MALTVFVAVSALVSILVGRALRRSREAMRARAEAEALARTTGHPHRRARSAAPLWSNSSAAASAWRAWPCSRRATEIGWTTLASSGPAGADVAGRTGDVDRPRRGRDQRRLVLTGGQLGAVDQGVLRAFADQLAPGPREPRAQAGGARGRERWPRPTRSAAPLLQAVSHDLRTPLASIKAAVTSLLQTGRGLVGGRPGGAPRHDRHRHRSARPVGGQPARHEPAAERRAQPALRPGGPGGRGGRGAQRARRQTADRTDVDVPETVPLVEADPALLERAVANVVSNALAWSPGGPAGARRGRARAVSGSASGSSTVVRASRPPSGTASSSPSVALGDRSNDAGVGLGLAVAHGFVTAMHGDISVDDTPGGGLTVTICWLRRERRGDGSST